MRFPVYSINMTIRDYNNLLIRGGTNHILFAFSLKLRREPLNHNSGAYSIKALYSKATNLPIC